MKLSIEKSVTLECFGTLELVPRVLWPLEAWCCRGAQSLWCKAPDATGASN